MFRATGGRLGPEFKQFRPLAGQLNSFPSWSTRPSGNIFTLTHHPQFPSKVKQIVWSDHDMISKYHRLWPKLKVCPALYSSVITCSLPPRSTSPKCVRARRQRGGCNYPNRPAVQSSSQRGAVDWCPRRRGGIARQGRGMGSQSGNIGSAHWAIDLHPVEIGLLC